MNTTPATPATPATTTYYTESTMPNGKGITSTVLTASDGSGYKCADCDYAGPKFAAVWGHRKAHSTKPPRNTTTKTTSPAPNDVMQALVTLNQYVNESTSVVASAASWKQRALDAEKRLRAMRRALTPNPQDVQP